MGKRTNIKTKQHALKNKNNWSMRKSKEIKLSLFEDDMILHTENPKFPHANYK